MKNIYLIGLPGCGKSTIGKIISSEMNMAFVDLDEYIVTASGKSISELFEVGEDFFREWETKCLREVLALSDTVVATGGGIVERDENTAVMKESGKVVYIHVTPERIMENSTLDGRPLLAKDKNRIFTLFERRFEKYKSAADYIVDNMSTIEETVKNIIKITHEF